MRCAREGVMTSVEVMPVTPWFPHAAGLLLENPRLDVGAHLALTSEWDNIKWRPLTPCPSLVDSQGFFRPMVVPHPHYFGKSHAENKWVLDEIERELRAQIESTLAVLPHTSHVTTHMCFEELDPSVATLVDGLASEYGIHISPNQHGVRLADYVGTKATSADKIEAFLRMIATLEAGNTYMFVEHPGLDTPELRGAGHIGYQDVALDRQGATDCLTDGSVRAAIASRSIHLASYRDLAGRKRGRALKFTD
jgi:predicted glycoside hydrolase/deacetylase ChbG (UPF0249 family)